MFHFLNRETSKMKHMKQKRKYKGKSETCTKQNFSIFYDKKYRNMPENIKMARKLLKIKV